MIESWDDAITVKQHIELQKDAVEALSSFDQACKNNDVRLRLEIAYIDGMRLCFYPVVIARDFGVNYSGLVVEKNFGRRDAELLPVHFNVSYYHYDWAVRTFRLTPKFLREFTNKLYEKVLE